MKITGLETERHDWKAHKVSKYQSKCHCKDPDSIMMTAEESKSLTSVSFTAASTSDAGIGG